MTLPSFLVSELTSFLPANYDLMALLQLGGCWTSFLSERCWFETATYWTYSWSEGRQKQPWTPEYYTTERQVYNYNTFQMQQRPKVFYISWRNASEEQKQNETISSRADWLQHTRGTWTHGLMRLLHVIFLPGPCSVYSGHNRHQTWQNCLSPIITAAVCRATETKHPTGHYIDAALDRSTESSHQTSSGTKWQITPLSCLSLSLRFSLCLPLSLSLSLSPPLCLSWSFCLSFSFQQALSSLSFLPRGLSSHSFSFPSTDGAVCLSLCFYLLPLFAFFSLSYSPISLNLSLSLSVTSCHLGRPDSSVDVGNERWLTCVALSNTPRVGQAEARPWAGITVTVTMRSGRLTVQFGKLTGFTALVQQGQSTERTRSTLDWGQGGRGDDGILRATQLLPTRTKQHNMVFITRELVGADVLWFCQSLQFNAD